MKVWSKGLGSIVLSMDARRYYVEVEDDKLLVKGKILDPVLWKFKLTVQPDDITGMVNVIFKWRTLLFALKNFHMVFVFIYEKMFKREKFVPAE
jgi:hypothetical protein